MAYLFTFLTDHDETYQAYSSFTTNHKPPGDYENLLVAASKLRGPAVKAYDRREQFEQSLVWDSTVIFSPAPLTFMLQKLSSHSLEAYAYYISSERRMKHIDMFILCGLYERAIAEAARRRFEGEQGAEEALRTFWGGYCDVLVCSQDTSAALERVLNSPCVV